MKQYRRVPFDIELAKKVQSGEIEGRIVTITNNLCTLIDATYGIVEEYNIPIIVDWEGGKSLLLYNKNGESNIHEDVFNIVIELPEETPKYTLEDEKVVYKQYKNSSILLDKILKNVGCDFNEKEKESFEKVKKYLDDIISMQANRLEETPKHEFKPFDKVLVKRSSDYGNTLGTWTPAIFQKEVVEYGEIQYLASGLQWYECIPYEGNEHLVGTTDKPKEE